MNVLEVDVAIVGGGIMGTSAALHLRREHRLTVALLERARIGSQASGVNFGNVRRQGRFLPQLPLAHRSRRIWGRLRELTGEDGEFLATGHLKVAYDEAEMADLEAHARDARDWGLGLELLGANALRGRYPWLGPDVHGACLSPEDGHANPRLVAPAFGRAARDLGARVHEHTEVLDVGHDGTRFRVGTGSGLEVRASCLVNTAGAWGGGLSARFGEPVPLQPLGPQMAVTEPLPYFISPVLGTVSASIYLRQVRRGNIVYGGGLRAEVQPDPPRARALPEHSRRQWGEVARLVPALSGVQVIRTWSGVEGYMPDMIPVLGPSRTTPGLVHAFGFSGHGFQLGPGVGAVVAELVARGETDVPIAPFAIDRFARGAGADDAALERHTEGENR